MRITPAPLPAAATLATLAGMTSVASTMTSRTCEAPEHRNRINGRAPTTPPSPSAGGLPPASPPAPGRTTGGLHRRLRPHCRRGPWSGGKGVVQAPMPQQAHLKTGKVYRKFIVMAPHTSGPPGVARLRSESPFDPTGAWHEGKPRRFTERHGSIICY